jgi:hypothetical protein
VAIVSGPFGAGARLPEAGISWEDADTVAP